MSKQSWSERKHYSREDDDAADFDYAELSNDGVVAGLITLATIIVSVILSVFLLW